MGFVGKEPAEAALTSADITDGIIVDADINASANIAMSKTAFSAGTGVTLSTNTLNVDASQAITALTGGDLTIYDDANNADVSLAMGTSATESLIIQVLNGGSNKTAEEVHFSTATASGTADHGKMVFDVDGTDIFSIDDNGVNLLTDSSILSIGADNDATFTHDGTTGLTIAATPISIDSTGELHLNSTTGDIKLQDGGTDQITFDLDGTAGEVIMKPAVDSDDLVISQYDGTEVIRIEDNASLGLVGNKLSIANSSSDVVIKPLTDAKDIIFQQYDGTEVARVEDNATFNIGTSKLAINGTAVTATAAELNLLDGGTSVGGSITLADSDGVVVNDGGTMKTIPASDISTYIGSGGGTTDLVADGAISAGKPVAITSAGKAKEIAALQTGVNNTTLTNINSFGGNEYMQSAADPDTNRILTVFRDGGNSNRGTAIVIDVDSNGDFTEGSEVVFETDSTGYCHVIYDPNVDRFAVFWLDNTGPYSYAAVAQIDNSDNSVSFGSNTNLGAISGVDDNISGYGLYFDPDQNKIGVAVNNNAGGSQAIKGLVGTITGGGTNTIAFGSAATISGDATSYTGNGYGTVGCYDTVADRGLFVFGDSGDSHKLTSVVTTISGTSMSVGSEVHVTETNTASDTNLYPAMVFDSGSGKAVFMCYNSSQGDGEVYVGTVTGSSTNTCSWGSATVIADGDGSYDNALLDAGDGNIVFAHEDRTKTNGSNLIQTGVITVSGTSAVVKHRQKLYTTYVDTLNLVKGGQGNKIVALSEVGTNLFGAAPDLPGNASAFIGFANSAISDTATGTIQLHGTIATNQSSLSVGSLYYLTSAGALSTTATSFAKIGHALSATTLLIQGTLPDST